MKKILAFILATLSVFSSLFMFSCDDDSGKKTKEIAKLNGMTPQELYAVAKESFDEIQENCKFVVDINYDYSVSGQKVSMQMKQTQYMKDGNIHGITKTTSGMAIGDTTEEVWYVDGTYYCLIDGEKVKFTLTQQQLFEIFGVDYSSTGEEMLMDIPESMFKDIKFTKKGLDYSFEIELDGQTMMDDILSSSYFETIFGTLDGWNASVDKYVLDVHFNSEGEITFYEGDMKCKFDMMGMEMDMDMKVRVDVEKGAVLVPITPPEDADSYTDCTDEIYDWFI